VHYIHPDICDLDLNATDKNPRSEVIESSEVFLAKSRKERKAFRKQMKDQ
jgi:hypothetical protein